MADNRALGVRARARAELTAEILEVASRHLVEHGAAGLSLRAVSRDLGMASSAIYRYFPSRDALLTALIVAAYDSLGEAAENAEAAVMRDDLLGRWRAVSRAARAWARAHPHEYALIYGTPVPGYAAPSDTVDPATRVTMLLLSILADVDATEAPVPHAVERGAMLDGQLAALCDVAGVDVDHDRLLAGISAWTNLFGMISFELFGQFNTIFDDADALFAYQTDVAAIGIGLTVPPMAPN